MGQIQEAIKELAAKKRELTEQYNQIKEEMERHEEEGQARLAAEQAEEGDPEKWEKKIARANEKCKRDHERIQAQRDALVEQGEEYEKKVEYEDEQALARAEEFKERMAQRLAMADAAKEEAYKAADEARDACIEQNKQNEIEMNNKIKELQGEAFGRDEAIRDEIAECAEKMLKINEMIQERLE